MPEVNQRTVPNDERVTKWFERRFGSEFSPSDEQKAWVKEN